MITTPDLIAALAANMKPVRRLRAPLFRATCWIALAAAVLTLLAIERGVRPDLVQRLHEAAFVTCLAAALITGICAAVSTFFMSLPDRSRLWLLLPVPALTVWLCNIGYQCLTDWVVIGPGGLNAGEAARCFATLALTSLPLSLVMMAMLGYAARFRPTAVAATGGLAVAAMTATALSLFHPVDASLMILIWNVGVAILFASLGAIFGNRAYRRSF